MLLNNMVSGHVNRRQRGNGVGNFHGARHSTVIPIDSFVDMQMGKGKEVGCPQKGHKLQNITTTQQAVEIDRSELKREDDAQLPHPIKKARAIKPQSKKRKAPKMNTTKKKKKAPRVITTKEKVQSQRFIPLETSRL